MGIFGTKQAKRVSVDETYKMIASYYKRRGFEIDEHQLPECDGYGWWIMEGSAKVYIFLQEEERGHVIRVNAPVCHFPQDHNERFFRTLLEINRDLSAEWPNITRKGEAPADAEDFRDVPDKYAKYFSDKPGKR